MLTREIRRFEVREGVVHEKIHGECLSADVASLPTENIINGSDVIVMDAGKIVLFDEENSQWVEWSEA